MIEPVLRDEAFLRDVAQARSEPGQFHLWWLGQSGFLVQWQEQHLLLDPYLSDSLTKKYAETDKPHVRMTARLIAPDRLDLIDVVTSSHNHTDHLDGETLGPLLRANPKLRLIIPEANRQFVAERLGLSLSAPIGLDVNRSVTVEGFTFTGVSAAHETIEHDEQGRCRYLGYVIEFGGWAIYHSGDTLWHDQIVAELSRWQLDLMLLPINGRNPARRVAGNMNGTEAARLAKTLNARLVVPCHYEMFEFNTASPDEFVGAAGGLGQPFRVLRCGERWGSAQLAPGEGRGSSIQKRLP